jgi:hypothetical protein
MTFRYYNWLMAKTIYLALQLLRKAYSGIDVCDSRAWRTAEQLLRTFFPLC